MTELDPLLDPSDRPLTEDEKEQRTKGILDLAERRATVLRMKNAGANHSSIAQQLGISRRTVIRDIEIGIASILNEPAEELIGQQRSIIKDIRRASYVAMMGGDLKAAKTIMETLDHEAKLLGLYAPTRVNVGVNDADFAEMAATLMKDIGVQPPEALTTGRVEGRVDSDQTIIDAELDPSVAVTSEQDWEPWVQ